MTSTTEEIRRYREYFLDRSGYKLESATVEGQELSWLVVSPDVHAPHFPEGYTHKLFVQHFKSEPSEKEYLFVISDQFDSDVRPLIAYTEYLEIFDETTKGTAYLSAKETANKIIDPEVRARFASSYSSLLKYEIENPEMIRLSPENVNE